ncbi:hypothetical protein RPMA_07130 [Tardiphaga alba]|uniref:NusG domain-containing protein n=1 Tax=Tardiphaga alba TaxID=340268 RepID=A0ABX8A5X7_9BRAD|nr:hypothetical protein [Tardiphaga alba]QUS38632.1 hypothetical protein RPMA_07130 [Tardiphaga alba]
MSELPVNTNSAATHASKRSSQWWYLAPVGLIVAAVWLAMPQRAELDVTLRPGGEIRIQNVGDKAVAIEGVLVNGEQNCAVVTMLNLDKPADNPWPIDLSVGSAIGLFPACRPIRIAVATSAGSSNHKLW